MAQNPGGNIVFEVQDWRGRPVRLTRRTFETHAAKREEFADYLEQAKLTIQDPDLVGDAGYGGVALFRFGLGKGRYANLYLRVVVYYRNDPETGTEASHRFTKVLDTLRVIEHRYQWIAGQRIAVRGKAAGPSMIEDKPAGVDFKAIAKANGDLSQRLSSEGVTIAYDEDTDTLLIDIGGPNSAIEDEVAEGLSVRYDPVTLKCVGGTIFAFASAHKKMVRKLFRDRFEQFKQSGGKVEWHGSEAAKAMPLFEAALGGRA